jgi:muramoyltetrapeptide carboxypeptidase
MPRINLLIAKIINFDMNMANNLTIGVFAPANPMTRINPELIVMGTKHLESLGFTVKFAKNIMAEHHYTAGKIEERLEDFHQLITDKSISLLMSVYGGYNSNQLLDQINYQSIIENPKPVIGYSDMFLSLDKAF